MPIVSSFMSSQMQLKSSSVTVSGSKFSGIVSAVSNAVASYVPSTAQVQSTNIVVGPGAGTFTGRVSGLSAPVMSKLMQLKAAIAGLTGRDIGKLCDAVSFGVIQAMRQVTVQGTVVGGGPGSGNGKILALVAKSLEPIIIANLSAKILMGSKTKDLISAIAFGVCNHIMSAGTITTTCIGAFAGPPTGPVTIPAAPGMGKLV